jgi:hypothetical protein
VLLICASGRTLTVPNRDLVYVPVGDYREGDAVDYATVDFVARRVSSCVPGTLLIVDNRVEKVVSVGPPARLLKSGF